MINIRLATLEDLPRVALLFDAYRQFYEQPADLARATRFLCERLQRDESHVLVAETPSGDVVGFCQLYPSFCSVRASPVMVLYDLYVTPDARRSGAGKALLLAAEAHAAKRGAARLDLTTARTNTSAQALYASLGWDRDDVFLAYSKAITVAPDC
jgi:ribosomal protein S18 acetylase RimI-like enzyme